MITALAFCPHPPLLVSEVARAAAPELDPLRVACDEVLADVLATDPETVVLLGAGLHAGEYPAGSAGSLAPYGVDVRVALSPDAGDPPVLPLPLTIGAWLLARSGWSGPAQAIAVEQDAMAGPGRRKAVAESLRERPGRVGLVVLADGSNSRSEKAPGAHHPDAHGFDAAVAAVLAGGDPGEGRRIPYERAVAVGSTGWSTWRTAFHAARRDSTAPPWRARLVYDDAPYGVGYLVASWT